MTIKKVEGTPAREELIDKFRRDLEAIEGRGISHLFIATVGYSNETESGDGVDVRLSLGRSDELEGGPPVYNVLNGVREAILAAMDAEKEEMS